MISKCASSLELSIFFFFFFFFFVFFLFYEIPASPQEVLALLRIKQSLIDPRKALASWNESGTGVCTGTWSGIKCARGNIISIALPAKGLGGTLSPAVGQLVGLRKLNLHNNAITGPIPSILATIPTLRGLALFNNQFSGPLPVGLGSLPLLQQVDISHNMLSGALPTDLGLAGNLTLLNLSFNNLSGPLPPEWAANTRWNYLNDLNLASNQLEGSIPSTFVSLVALTTLDLSQNSLSGSIPPSFSALNLTSFNVSYNNLSGPVPAFSHGFSLSSYKPGNDGLCGYSGLSACPTFITPASSPAPGLAPAAPQPSKHRGPRLSTLSIIFIALGSALVGLAIVCALVCVCCCRAPRAAAAAAAAAAGAGEKAERSPETEGGEVGGKLVHFDDPLSFTADDLLCATAEVLGKSTYGTVYKATLENGSNIAVKRLREGIVKSQGDFEKEVDILSKIRHPNLLSLRAFYWGPKQEKLLVFDYMRGGSLARLLHARGPETVLDWGTRIRIAAEAAHGLLHLHSVGKMVHGNLTATNILLDTSASPTINACISDYGLSRLMTPAANANVVATARSLGYRAPELTKIKRASTKSDVYSFGIILLELLTGKAPGDVTAREGAVDLPDYVAEVVKENWTAEVFDLELMKGPAAPSEEELMTALQLAMRCVTPAPASRPEMDEVVRLLQDLQPEEQVQSSPSA
ncbi:unnamed protein product [Sphagnum troendelagicum]